MQSLSLRYLIPYCALQWRALRACVNKSHRIPINRYRAKLKLEASEAKQLGYYAQPSQHNQMSFCLISYSKCSCRLGVIGVLSTSSVHVLPVTPLWLTSSCLIIINASTACEFPDLYQEINTYAVHTELDHCGHLKTDLSRSQPCRDTKINKDALMKFTAKAIKFKRAIMLKHITSKPR